MPGTPAPKPDPNAPLIAYQRRLDADSRFEDEIAAGFHQGIDTPILAPGCSRRGCPGLDAQEGSTDE